MNAFELLNSGNRPRIDVCYATRRRRGSNSVEEHKTAIYDANLTILQRHVELALYSHGCLSPKQIKRSEFNNIEPEKSYTVTVYEAGGGKQVMFANEKEYNTLLRIMEDAVGVEKMSCMRRKLSEEISEVEIIASEVASGWNKDWPLK